MILATLAFVAFAAGDPPATVCLTELAEVQYYDVTRADGVVGEVATWTWSVEIAENLPNGLVGWNYAGVVVASRLIWYDCNTQSLWAWWSAKSGQSGVEETPDDAIRAIVATIRPAGDLTIRRR